MGVEGLDFGVYNVFECSKVYFDLFIVEVYENVNEYIFYFILFFRIGLGRLLEIIF